MLRQARDVLDHDGKLQDTIAGGSQMRSDFKHHFQHDC